MIDERTYLDTYKALPPFHRTIAYWQNENDLEILNRLNPEIRELAEEIINAAGSES